MPERGLEPPPSYLDKNLNLARLPIPPLGRVRPPRGRQVGKSYQRVTGPQGGRGDAGHGVTGLPWASHSGTCSGVGLSRRDRLPVTA